MQTIIVVFSTSHAFSAFNLLQLARTEKKRTNLALVYIKYRALYEVLYLLYILCIIPIHIPVHPGRWHPSLSKHHTTIEELSHANSGVSDSKIHASSPVKLFILKP